MRGFARAVLLLFALAGLALLGSSVGGLRPFWESGGAPDEPGGAPPLEPLDPAASRAPAGPRAAVEEREAEVRAPRDPRGAWSELNDEAIAALERGELELAVELFRQCRGAVPEEPVFTANLAEALARLARARHARPEERAAALEGLAEAVALAPERTELASLLERWRREAETEAEFWTDETAHFLLSYDGARTELLKSGYVEVTRLLEEVHDELGLAFNHYPVGHGDPKIRVVLYRREEFAAVTGIGHWAGGVYDGVVRIPLGDFSRERRALERALRHELVHAFVRSMGGAQVPAWLNEGVAQWHEGPPGSRALAVQAARARLAESGLLPLEELGQSFATWNDEDRIARAYAQSLALVDHLVRWYGEHVVLALLAGCGEGTSAEETFRLRTARGLEDVVAELREDL